MKSQSQQRQLYMEHALSMIRIPLSFLRDKSTKWGKTAASTPRYLQVNSLRCSPSKSLKGIYKSPFLVLIISHDFSREKSPFFDATDAG